MNKSPIIIADADAIIAQTDTKDPHHDKASNISKKLFKLGAQVIYPATAVVEATTHLQRVLNNTESAFEVAQLMTKPESQVAEVNQKTLEQAVSYFSPSTSKKNTLFDCIVAAIADEKKADAIFSFDHFYKAKGFTLAIEL